MKKLKLALLTLATGLCLTACESYKEVSYKTFVGAIKEAQKAEKLEVETMTINADVKGETKDETFKIKNLVLAKDYDATTLTDNEKSVVLVVALMSLLPTSLDANDEPSDYLKYYISGNSYKMAGEEDGSYMNLVYNFNLDLTKLVISEDDMKYDISCKYTYKK